VELYPLAVLARAAMMRVVAKEWEHYATFGETELRRPIPATKEPWVDEAVVCTQPSTLHVAFPCKPGPIYSLTHRTRA
jgi:hypothetical protein